MVAYSFKSSFINPIRVGLGTYGDVAPAPWPKRHTIRGHRRRHARPGEIVQLYSGQRTKGCFKIGEARCTRIERITLRFRKSSPLVTIGGLTLDKSETRIFVRDDGFASVDEFVEFWRAEHGAPALWQGVIIYWEPINQGRAGHESRLDLDAPPSQAEPGQQRRCEVGCAAASRPSEQTPAEPAAFQMPGRAG